MKATRIGRTSAGSRLSRPFRSVIPRRVSARKVAEDAPPGKKKLAPPVAREHDMARRSLRSRA